MLLIDIIAADGFEHVALGIEPEQAMLFRKFETANAYRVRLAALGYDAHIEGNRRDT